LFCEGPRIHAADLPPEISGNAGVAAAAAAAAVPHPLSPPGATPAGGTVMPPLGPDGQPRASSLKELVRQETERVERELIVRALDETGGNVTQAARKLKISRKSLQNKMKEFGLRDRE